LKEREEAPITIFHLATHTSGLPRLPLNLKPSDPRNPYGDYTSDRLHKFLTGYRPPRAPGERSEYSNLAAGLLGDILARDAGKSYGELAQERVLRPLAMDDTSITLNKSQRERLAPPHGAGGESESNWDIPGLAGAGALRSTADDMLKFMAAQIEPPKGALDDAIDLAWQDHQPPIVGNPFAMGLGWHIARDGETRWHTGQTGGYHAAMFVSRYHKVGVVVLANTATDEVDRLAQDVTRLLAGAKVAPRQFEKQVHVAPEVVARYAGNYQLVPGFVLTVTAEGNKLYVQATGQQRLRVYPKSDTVWHYKVVDAQITFKVSDDGACSRLELKQNGLTRPANRLADEAQ
jgi:serine-type D-Ala-D-Ala carboxypeptidase/endopeptidase